MKRTLLRLAWYWGPLLAYAAAIYYLSSLSHSPLPTLRFPHADKVVHLLEYAGFGSLLCRGLALKGEGLSPGVAVVSTVLLATLYGTTDELHQSFVPGRDADLFDLLADVVGAGAGAVLYRVTRLRGLAGGPTVS